MTFIKYPICFLFLFTLGISSKATHYVGGELSYKHISGNRYEVTLEKFMDCSFCPYDSCFQVIGSEVIHQFNGDRKLVKDHELEMISFNFLDNTLKADCLVKPLEVPSCAIRFVFRSIVSIKDHPKGNNLVYRSCCRTGTLLNVNRGQTKGITLSAFVPSDKSPFKHNNSPKFNYSPPSVTCSKKPIRFDHSATDIDGDELEYRLCYALDGYQKGLSGEPLNELLPPPYLILFHANGYSPENPIDANPAITINANTGFITGTPSVTSGQYAVGICVDERRNGELIATHRRDFQYNVGDCTKFVDAEMFVDDQNFYDKDDTIINCTSYSVNFKNAIPLSSTNDEWFWNFGDPTVLDDTTRNREPGSYTYPDTGLFKAYVVAGYSGTCVDTHTIHIGIYPGYEANIGYDPFCFEEITHFYDNSKVKFGENIKWEWDLGNNFIGFNETENTVYLIDSFYKVTLISTSSVGCTDTVTTTVQPLVTPIAAFESTPTCLDQPVTFHLLENEKNAALENVFWQIDRLDTSTLSSPTIVFDSIGDYIISVKLTAKNGCTDEDFSIISIKPAAYIELDTFMEVCENDPLHIDAKPTNVTFFDWSPANSLLKPSTLHPVAVPKNSTTYTLKYGNECETKKAELYVHMLPAPQLKIQRYHQIKYGDSAVLETSKDGTSFRWEPAHSISNYDSANATAYPEFDTEYTLIVTDSNGCRSNATTIVDVQPACANIKTPTAFTPNSNNENDHFKIVNYGGNTVRDLKIWNKWGEVIYFSEDNDRGWDGTINGGWAPIGVYTYEAYVNCENSKTERLTGNLTLIR